MANSTLTNLFVDIADAIREKSDTSESIPALEFPDAIRSISGGGGSDCLPVPDEYQSFVPDIYTLQESTGKRLTTFYANDFTRVSGESDISFRFSDAVDGDVQGIWAKISFPS